MTLSRSCLAGGGEAGERLRAVDWSNNPLGPVEGWPISLQSTVRIILGSEFPMMLHWGPDLVTVYNDAYAPSLGNKHPGNLGRPAREWWSEMWDQLSPIFDRVLSGKPFFVEDARYTPERDGEQREAFFTHCHSPVWDDQGRVAGIFLVVTETTRRVVAERGLVQANTVLTGNEKRLAESEAYWRGLFERLNEGFMVVEVVRDAAGVARTWRFAEINEAWERISGLPRAEATGRPVDEVIPGVEREWIDRYIRIAETGEPENFRMPLEALGQFYEVRAFRVAPDRVGVLFQEISARQREEVRRAALLELSECLRDLSETEDMAFATAQILGRALQVSRAGYATMTDGGEGLWIERDWTAPGFVSGAGSHRTASFGGAVADLDGGQPVIISDTALDERTATEGRAGFDAYAVRALVNWPLVEDGRLVAFLYVNDGNAREWLPEEIAFLRTVAEQTRSATERRRAEHALRTLNASLERQVRERTAELRLYRDIVQSDRSPILAFDTAYRLTGFNQAHHRDFLRVMGHDQQVGDCLPDLFPPDQAAMLRGLMDRALGGETFSVTEAFGDKERAKPTWEITYTPLRDEEGNILGAFHHARDVSARLRAERDLNAVQEQLRQAQKMEAVGQLTGGVAHDFNNLLTVIKSSTDLLKRPALAEERRLRYVAAISDTVDRAAKLTGQLLAFARRQALKPEVFAACDGVRALSEMMATLTGSR
ncbi:PAS domain-containing protein, partial [Methylobacterium sp. E-065]|uniref:PAS domain-containing protein n=1 Tax=Methylobacterium sp. E-065 TaxID=2836583 RepID=UPI001FB9B14B